MTTKQILKNLKPTELDVSLKYICPQCQNNHWLFLREAKTKNFKIICECGSILKPKRINQLTVKYYKETTKKTDKLSVDTINKCVRILSDYGFDKKQSLIFVKQAYDQIHSNDISSLIKISIKLFGEL